MTLAIDSGMVAEVEDKQGARVGLWMCGAVCHSFPERYADLVEMVANECRAQDWRCVAVLIENTERENTGFVMIERGIFPYGEASKRFGTLMFDAAPERHKKEKPVSFHWGHYDMTAEQALRSLEARAGVEE